MFHIFIQYVSLEFSRLHSSMCNSIQKETWRFSVVVCDFAKGKIPADELIYSAKNGPICNVIKGLKILYMPLVS